MLVPASPARGRLSSRTAQLTLAGTLLLLVGPVTQLLHERLLPDALRFEHRADRENVHALGMAAFVGDAQHAHAVSAVSSWHAAEAARAAAAAGGVKAVDHELAELHIQQSVLSGQHIECVSPSQ